MNGKPIWNLVWQVPYLPIVLLRPWQNEVNPKRCTSSMNNINAPSDTLLALTLNFFFDGSRDLISLTCLRERVKRIKICLVCDLTTNSQRCWKTCVFRPKYSSYDVLGFLQLVVRYQPRHRLRQQLLPSNNKDKEIFSLH